MPGIKQLVVTRNASPVRDTVAMGKITAKHVVATHFFGTGSQQLVFDSIDHAKEWADDYDLEFIDARVKHRSKSKQ